METLKAVRMVKEQLGLKTALGVSNIEFWTLPLRPIINRTFLTMAMECGLDLPIINPNSEDMMASIFAFHVLHNIDENAMHLLNATGMRHWRLQKFHRKKTQLSQDLLQMEMEVMIYFIVSKKA